MAFNAVKAVLFSCILFFSLQSFSVVSFEFQVGGTNGWVIPPSNDTKVYNDWASDNRFQLGDTIRFRYGKDSVMEVTEEDYKKCNSSHPNFFSNTGNTVFKLNHTGPFYFISGAFEHCQKGQRMIIKVKTPGEASSGGATSTASPTVAVSSLFWFSKLIFSALFSVSYAAYIVV
ncbi:Phytocyanin domain containing protein [Parasponia andersonii]|uniref:Phytocyanin domain containing protein n=1 Tax=Parasponia andersonii TaxID=3476 RepID=A0A2P5B5K2_PARAD|nr:Phytocyanin domain containing protein [Parasponia andersonii]